MWVPKRCRPAIRQNATHGVGKPRLDSGRYFPIPSYIGTPMPPTLGWASMCSRPLAKVSSRTTVSGFRSSACLPEDLRMAWLLATENPRCLRWR